MSEYKNAPQIRFKDFDDAWEQRKLDRLLEQYTEVTTINNQYPALTSSRKGIFFQTEYFAGNQIASQNNVGYNIVPRNYFTYRHMSDDEIFHFNINNICDFGIVSTLYPVFTTKKELDSKYLQYQLNYGKEFAKFASLQKQGGSRTYMYFAKLKELVLTMPKVEEQTKISSILSNIDNLITLHQRKYNNLVNVKKSLLEKMFPKNSSNVPEIRFKGFTDAWEQRKLNEFTRYISSNLSISASINNGKYNLYDANNIIGKVNCKNISEEFITIIKDGSGVGKVRRLPKNSCFIGTMGGILSKESNIDFVYCCLLNTDFTKEINGATIPHIYYSNYGNNEYYVPKYLEQEKIGELFTNLDNLITLHQRKLEKLNELKKSMLDKMFI